ncbi:hypothetical protein RMN57_17175 [Kitasatospora sp. CM 4170]|uniref:Uncharacterized protein n=1 Tax=Kitasatospora aburaviensis TaxID=67265 RepID=A0ABW1EWP9_9ACTN|nr:hypothetical protein [Kitasatospora sp. CM 4170]WNM46308.1 hypothetical protein RMN57_17175 [Kitasatospora sp. CM 4170]
MSLTSTPPPIPPITDEDRDQAAGAADRLLTRLLGARGGAR